MDDDEIYTDLMNANRDAEETYKSLRGREFVLYLENTKMADFEYRFDELNKFMQRVRMYYPMHKGLRIGAEKALEVLWHPITRPYTVYARFLPRTLLEDSQGKPMEDPKNTFEIMSVNWFQVGNRLKLIFTHERWFLGFPPLFDLLGEIGKDWQEAQRDIWKYIQELTEIDDARLIVLQEAAFKKSKHSLNLDCTYKEFIEWIKQKFPNSLLEENGNTFNVYLPSKEYLEDMKKVLPEARPETISKTVSHLVFEVVSSKPLRLEAIYSYYFDKDEAKAKDFITLANNYFGQKANMQGDAGGAESKPLPRIPKQAKRLNDWK